MEPVSSLHLADCTSNSHPLTLMYTEYLDTITYSVVRHYSAANKHLND